MIIYKNNGTKIELYHFRIDKTKAQYYKINKFLSGQKTCLSSLCHIVGEEKPIFKKREITEQDSVISLPSKDDKNPNTTYEYLITNHANENVAVEKYLNGDFQDNSAIKLNFNGLNDYFLLTEKDYEYLGTYNNGKNYILRGILRLPESLYILQMLEQGHFERLKNFNIEEQLKLFTIDKIDDLAIDEIKKLDQYGITDNLYQEILSKSVNGEPIIQYIKK